MNNTTLYGSYACSETPKRIIYGPGSLSTALPRLLDELGVHRALIVTGRSLYTKTDVVRRVEQLLNAHHPGGHVETFAHIREHAPYKDIQAGVVHIVQKRIDVLVSVGGGSPIDAAKAMSYFLYDEMKSVGNPDARYLPHIAIPTTLSAAEYTQGAGYTNERSEKTAVSAPELAPTGVILDAELTLPTPERLWLSTGVRALDHAVECLYRPGVPYPVKALSYTAIKDLFTFLPFSKAEPANVEYRQRLQLAAWMSLWPMKLEKYSPLGLSHALGHKLGAKYCIGHGITSCLTLAPIVALQSDVASQEDKEALAGALLYLGAPGTGSVENDVKGLSADIDRLVTDLGLKTDLATCGVPREHIPVIAAQALGGKEHKLFARVCELLEGLYPQRAGSAA